MADSRRAAFAAAVPGATPIAERVRPHGLLTALWISALMPIAGFITAAFLPRPHATT